MTKSMKIAKESEFTIANRIGNTVEVGSEVGGAVHGVTTLDGSASNELGTSTPAFADAT